MDVTTRLAGAPTVPWRRLAMIAAVALLLAVSIAIYVGSRVDDMKQAPPFGLAGNGLVAYEANGDIFVADPVTGDTTPIATSADPEGSPVWSPTGSRLAYTVTNRAGVDVVAVRPDGSGRTVVTPEPLGIVHGIAFSPDGSQLVIASQQNVSPMLALASVTGEAFEWLETNGPASLPVFRPPDGADLLFVSGLGVTTGQGLHAIDIASREITVIVPARSGGEFTGSPAYSPDGTRIAYTYWVPGTTDSRVYHVDAEGATDPIQVAVPSGVCCDGYLAISNDGTRLAFTRWYDAPSDEGIVIESWDDLGTGRFYRVPGMTTARVAWSPDDRFLLVTPLDADDRYLPQVLVDVESGSLVEIPWQTTSEPAWQRLPPP